MENRQLLGEDYEKITAKKPKSSIPDKVQKAIGVISFEPESVVPFGSWVYKSQLYPGDVDLLEQDYKCCDRKAAIKYFAKGFQKIVRRILKIRGAYLGDIKAGLDNVFKINIGQLLYDKSGKPYIIEYNPDRIAKDIGKLYDTGLLSKDETATLLMMLPNDISPLEFENLYDTLRDKWLLRWTGKEVLKGFKMLAGNRKITLEQAITQPTMTKIDMWMNIYGRFLEITDVYAFYFKDKEGNEELFNFANQRETIVDDLKKEVQKYAFSKKYFKPFKMVKRMWSIARMTGDVQMIELLTPLMQTDMGRLSQVNSEMETLISVLENVKSPPMASILGQIDNFRSRLANIYQIDWDEEGTDQKISDILKHKKNSKANKQYIIKVLGDMKKYFTKLISEHTEKYLKSVGLLPVPWEYLPENIPKEIQGGCFCNKCLSK